MSYREHVHNGAVALDESVPLPEGMEVRIEADCHKRAPVCAGAAGTPEIPRASSHRTQADLHVLDVLHQLG
jgi:hypothetical protein